MNKGLLKGYDITNWKFLKHRRQFFSLSIQNSRELLVLSFIQLLLLFLLFQSSAILAMLFCNECLRHWDNLQTKNHISWKQNQTLPPNTLSLEHYWGAESATTLSLFSFHKKVVQPQLYINDIQEKVSNEGGVFSIGKNYSILVVEDNNDMRDFIYQLLLLTLLFILHSFYVVLRAAPSFVTFTNLPL